LVIAIALFALGIIGSIRAISQNVAYQGVIGWLCWLAPMSWLVTLLGLSLFGLNLVGCIIGLFGVDFFKLRSDDANAASLVKDNRWTADWATGTLFLMGGWISNLNPADTAFDMGNFGFFDRKAKGDFRKHEAGHNLSLFAYGWIFHFVGAIDQNIGKGEKSIAERIAESHGSSSTTGAARPTLEVWS
jgi:hypothetical protein